MRKLFLTVISVLLCLFLTIPLFACNGDEASTSQKPSQPAQSAPNADAPEYYADYTKRAEVDNNGIIEDNFNGSIADFWKIIDGAWDNKPDNAKGNDYHNGCLKENVFLIDEYDGKKGVLALRATGDNYSYNDPNLNARFNDYKTDGLIDSTRSAASLVTPKTYGPGRYETVMKAAPVDGIVSALWTFYWANQGAEQHEIDIEIVSGGADGDFATIWYTSWTAKDCTENEKLKLAEVNLDYFLNDGQWHTFTFDWYTNYNQTGKKRIDWFIDGKCIYSLADFSSDIQNKIAYKGGNIWLGAWVSGWSGGTYRDWDTSYMYVDYFKHVPFKNQSGFMPTNYQPEYTLYTPVKTATGANNEYVVPTIDVPVNEWMSNGGFENVYNGNVVVMNREKVGTGNQGYVGWNKGDYLGETGGTVTLVNDVQAGSKALQITENAYAMQTYTRVYDNYKFDFEMYAKLADSESAATIEILFYKSNGTLNGTKTVKINVTETEYTQLKQQITAPSDTRKMAIRVVCTKGAVTIDSASLIFKGTD